MTIETKVGYEAQLDRRAGELFAVLTRTTDTVPVSKRGREWHQSSYRRTVQVIPMAEVDKLIGALVDTLAWQVLHAGEPADDLIHDRGDEPVYALCEQRSVVRERGPQPPTPMITNEVGRFWSNAEAEEAGYRLAETSDAERITTRDTTRDAGYDVVSVIRG